MGEELAREYRGLVVFGPFEPVDPPEISALQSEIGQAIPPAYRAFLEVANGGTLPYSVRVPSGPRGELISFSELYRLGRDRHGEGPPSRRCRRGIVQPRAGPAAATISCSSSGRQDG